MRPLLVPLKPLIGPRGVVLLLGSIAIWIAEATVYGMVAESVNISLGLKGALGVVAFTNLAALIWQAIEAKRIAQGTAIRA